MATKIKNYFAKRRQEAKFKLAGTGHRLDSDADRSARSSDDALPPPPVSRVHSSESAQRAGAAALARFETHQKPADMSNRSQAVIRAEALKELEAEKTASSKGKSKKTHSEVLKGAPLLAVSGVFFNCPLVGNYVLPKDEMKAKIREFLYQQLEEERGLTACLILQTCNTSREKITIGIQTLSRYIQNIVEHPTDEKYRKIRASNKAFQERIACLEGAHDFLLAAGFEMKSLSPGEGEANEDYYVFSDGELGDIENLQILQDALVSAEPIRPMLDRNMKVFSFESAPPNVSFPDDFYNVTADEIKREQQLRKEVAEKLQTFRTKAMREQDDLRELRIYKYTLLRIRFPDDIVLQGTFAVREPVKRVYEFVREHIEETTRPFFLVTVMGNRLPENDEQLLDLRLVPAVILNFIWDPEAGKSPKGKKKGTRYLKQYILALLQSV